MFGLYFLQTCATKLILTKNAYEDSGGATLVIRIHFIRFPALEILEYNRRFKDDLYIFEFRGCQSHCFSMKCNELAKKMKKIPIKIGVFRDGDSYPICHTCTYLSGCACNLASLSTDELAPFDFKGPFDLVDPGDTLAGQLNIDISITNMGKFLITRYGLGPGYCVLKNHPEGDEYRCSYKTSSGKLSTGENTSFAATNGLLNGGNRTSKLYSSLTENCIKNMAGISPVAQRLALGRPPPKPPRPPLEDPSLLQRGKKKKGKKKGKKK